MRFSRAWLLLALAVILGCSEEGDNGTQPEREPLLIYPDGSGDFPTIQAAIDSAAEGSVIELADGLFYGDGNRDIDLRGKRITIRSQSRDPERCILDCEGNSHDIHQGFIMVSEEGRETVLEGITILNGWTTRSIFRPARGAVQVGPHASPRISNCVFEDNVGVTVHCDSSSSPLIQGCLFRNNGLECVTSYHASMPLLTDCVFEDNPAHALIARDSAQVRAERCLFTGPQGSAASVRDAALTLANCEITDFRGGSLGCWRSTVILSDCTLADNRAIHSGGAIDLRESTATLTNCTLSNNFSTMGGGIYSSESTILLEECTLWGNRAMTGGASACFASTLRFRNCTVVENFAGLGSVAYCTDRSALSAERTIIAHQQKGGPFYTDRGSEVTLSCCDLYGNQGGDWVGYIAPQLEERNNFSADPLFCDQEGHAYHLEPGSPCSAENGEGCGLVGAWRVGCNVAGP